jgi:hypothetical protein
MQPRACKCDHLVLCHEAFKADPRAGSQTERVIDAVEDGIFLANQIYDKALLRFGQGNIDFKW